MARFKIFDSPRFGLVVAVFAGTIIVFLIAGIIFMRAHEPKMKPPGRSTGMTILYHSPIW